MRNLIRFLVRFHFFILFLLFEILSLFLFIQNNRFQRAWFLNFTNEIGGAVHKRVNGVNLYLNLRHQNEALVAENAYLRNQLPGTRKIDTLTRKEFSDTMSGIRYRYLPARVVENSVNQQNNHLIIDKGSLHGLKPEMAVICPQGIVGIIKSVSKNYALVLSTLNRNLKISAKIKRNGYFGSLSWDGLNPRTATLLEIPFHVDLRKGDSLVTSGYSAIFPEGIPVGKLIQFEKPVGSNFYSIQVQLETDFQKLDYVYVVTDLFREEIKGLENELKNAD